MPHALAPRQPTSHTTIDNAEDALPQHMHVPEGEDVNEGPPPLSQCDNDKDSKDNDNDSDLGRCPTLYQEELPYVTGIAEYDPVEAHDGAFLACLPSYKDMQSLQVDSQDLDGYVNDVHPLAFAAKAMEEKMVAMEALEVWEIIDQAEVPYTTKGVRRTSIEITWIFKAKRFPDGSIKKRKVEGIDYFKTYNPAVSWSTIRTVMTLAVNLGLKSQQVDYTNAFVQAELLEDEEVYMSLPRG
eukprot:15332303-Ditylum_brightwellii.AAC.1